MKQCCGKCKYWKEIERKYYDQGRIGDCLKTPQYQPPYNAGNICKDFEPKEQVKKLNLLGYEFEVVWVDDKFQGNNISIINYAEHKIYIDKEYKSEVEETILHEIIHWISRQNRLDLTEQQVHSIAANLFS